MEVPATRHVPSVVRRTVLGIGKDPPVSPKAFFPLAAQSFLCSGCLRKWFFKALLLLLFFLWHIPRSYTWVPTFHLISGCSNSLLARLVGFSTDRFRAAPHVSLSWGVWRGDQGLVTTTGRKWAGGGHLVAIALRMPVFFACKLGMSREILIFLLQICQVQAVARFGVLW